MINSTMNGEITTSIKRKMKFIVIDGAYYGVDCGFRPIRDCSPGAYIECEDFGRRFSGEESF